MSSEFSDTLSTAIYRRMEQLFAAKPARASDGIGNEQENATSEYRLFKTGKGFMIEGLQSALRFQAESPERCTVLAEGARMVIAGDDISFDGSFMGQIQVTGLTEEILEHTLGLYGCFDVP